MKQQCSLFDEIRSAELSEELGAVAHAEIADSPVRETVASAARPDAWCWLAAILIYRCLLMRNYTGLAAAADSRRVSGRRPVCTINPYQFQAAVCALGIS